MTIIPLVTNPGELVGRMHMVTGATQADVARIAGVSLRTVSRWASGESQPAFSAWCALAKLVYPKDADLAFQLAQAGGATLESLGLVKARPLPPPPAPPPAPPLPAVPTSFLAEGVVCAAAEEMDAPPRAVRGILRVAFRRARQMHLSVEAMDDALSGPAPAAPRPAETKGAASKKGT